MRGYFAIGVEGLSKPMNLGNLMRTAHGFGAAFFFTIGADPALRAPRSDTSRSVEHLPWYAWDRPEDLVLPAGCRLVGVELAEGAIDLPSFRHPGRAAYVLGPERGSLSPAIQSRCAFVTRVPTAFAINVATAGAIVMYDRVRSLGGFAERPVAPGGPAGPRETPPHGAPVFRRPTALRGATVRPRKESS